MEKEGAILMMCVGEMYWEAARFSPLLPYLRFKKYRKKKFKYIILTREDRFDLYGKNADILVPLRIEGMDTEFLPNCWRLDKFPVEKYIGLTQSFKQKYEKRFRIIQHIYPDVIKGNFCNKYQFSPNEMIYKFYPRDDNYKLIKEYVISNDKKLVVIAPRYRNGFKRNWKYWNELYNMISNNNFLMDNFQFIICGKEGEYVPDDKNRFLDINHIKLTKDSSLIGLLIVILEKSFFTIGSQSAIPNLSLLMKVPVLEWGHQKTLHSKIYNIMNTPITFIEDKQYNVQPKVILKNAVNLLTSKMKEEKKK
jgi:hypothetical protein